MSEAFDLEVELEGLAGRLCVALGWQGYERLQVAVALDRVAELAGLLRDREVRGAVRSGRASWVSVGRWFGISRQGASKRWGPV